ncbi:hypothetical protein Bca52824_044746 [Brassica carinata]|uniref:Uncharacterized protein n=1 Tax=Brassica carinata TaxID=52824 RepID=A0A8X7RBT6_BRACI|nr:hypothetical protein Bca52824_044746 [Brassica carinata]
MGLTKMGQDYSYSQSSSSSESVDITSLLEAECQIYRDEADSSYCNSLPVQYPRQPEADDGIPTTCYCGAQPVLGCSYTSKNPCRRDNGKINTSKSTLPGKFGLRTN